MGKLKSGAKSLFTIAKNAVKGVDQSVPKEVAEERLSICNSCENLTVTKQCNICFCFIHAKSKYRQEHCPLFKWDVWEPDEKP